MLSGGLKRRVDVYTRTVTQTLSGAESVTYTKTLTTWAQEVRRSGQTREVMAQRFGDYTLELNIRIEHSINEEDRIAFVGDTDKYVVISKVANRQSAYNTFICGKIKE